MLILLSVGILILIFAIINYVNLTVAQIGFRAREMATRRLLGSSRKELFARLIAESTILTFVSFCIGLLLSYATVPFAGNLLDTQIDLNRMVAPDRLLIALAVILVIGLLSGLLPAWVISNAKPVEVVKGTFRKKTKMVYSKFFITFQHGITIAMVAAAIVMTFQLEHLIKAPLGYNTANIIDIDVRELNNKQMALTLANEFNQLASVKRTAFCEGLPFKRGNNYSIHYEGRNISYQGFVGDAAVFPIHHFGGSHQSVAGMIQDFQLENILFEPRPTLLQIKKIEDFNPWTIAVEVTGNPYEAFNQVKDIYERVTQFEFPGEFIDRQIEKSFVRQKRASTIVVIFSGIALLLSFLGLIAMSIYFIQQRSREIAVRKVFGSGNPDILSPFSGRVTRLPV